VNIIRFLVLWWCNATVNNISVILWWMKPECSVKTTDLPQVTDKLIHIMLYTLL